MAGCNSTHECGGLPWEEAFDALARVGLCVGVAEGKVTASVTAGQHTLMMPSGKPQLSSEQCFSVLSIVARPEQWPTHR